MAKDTIHISEAEAVSNFADVLARVRAGSEIVIGDEVRPVVVIRPAEPHVRLLSESIVEKLSHCRETLERIRPGCTLPRRRKAKRLSWPVIYLALH